MLIVFLVATPAIAQQIQSGVSGGSVNIPQTNLVPIQTPPSYYSSPSDGFGQFDPYATTPNSSFGASPLPGASSRPGSGVTVIGPPTPAFPVTSDTIAPSPPGGSLFSRIFSRPASSPIAPGFGMSSQGSTVSAPSIYGVPPQGGFVDSYGQPSNFGPSPNYSSPGYAPPPGYPSAAYPSTSPSTLFPGGIFANGLFAGDPQGYSAFRLLQGPRLRHSYVSGGDSATDLAINNTDVSVVFAFPNFLYSTQPIYVIPSFSLQLWDGPQSSSGADLPANAYNGFLDVGWNSDPNQMLGTELGIRVGAFTDFDTFNSDSIRVLGLGLVKFRLTPTSTLKAGAYYLDRNKVKLVPAGGILWQPNPYTRFDIFFPQPKLARYWRTLGTRDVWWYLTADYGGGSWTIKRADQTSDSVDINDIRAVFGFEWGSPEAIRAGRRSAFFEIGYVFDREIEYRRNPQDDIKPDDGIMISAGIGY